MAGDGMIGFLTVNGQGGAQLVAPWGGVERRLAVNPFAYGIPGPDGRPIVVDVSPTVVAGKLRDIVPTHFDFEFFRFVLIIKLAYEFCGFIERRIMFVN